MVGFPQSNLRPWSDVRVTPRSHVFFPQCQSGVPACPDCDLSTRLQDRRTGGIERDNLT